MEDSSIYHSSNYIFQKPLGNFALPTDWSYGGTVLERLYKLYKTGGGTYDFVFVVEPSFTTFDPRLVYVHKAIVAAGSPVLKTIIEEQDKAGSWSAYMYSEDYGLKQFKWMIEFLYTDNVKDLEGDCSGELREQLDNLLTVAKEFLVKPLEQFCTNKLKKKDMSLDYAPSFDLAKVKVDESASVLKKIGESSEMKVDTEETLGKGKPGNNSKSNIVKEVVSEVKQKLVLELEKDLMAEIKQEIANSDFKSEIIQVLANQIQDKLRQEMELEMDREAASS